MNFLLKMVMFLCHVSFRGRIYIYMTKFFHHGYFCSFLGTKYFLQNQKWQHPRSTQWSWWWAQHLVSPKILRFPQDSRLAGCFPQKKIKDDEIPTISVDCVVLGDTCDDWKTSQVAWVFHYFYRVSQKVFRLEKHRKWCRISAIKSVIR